MNSSADSLLAAVSKSGAHDAADLLEKASSEDAAKVLQQLNPMVAQQVLEEMAEETRTITLAFAPKEKAIQWTSNRDHPEDSVGWLMEPPVAVFRPDDRA
jgi:magnesium transporter